MDTVGGEYIACMFRPLLQGLARRIPSQCAVCRAWPAQRICDHCVAEFAQPVLRCPTCALPLSDGQSTCNPCSRNPPPWNRCLSAVDYAYPWSTLVLDFKFKEHTGWAREFAALMRSTPWIEPALEAADWVIPLPLSAQRLRERGFNQTLLLARALAAEKTNPHILLKMRDTAVQHTLPLKERLANVRQSFVVEPQLAKAVQGKRLVVLDDVMTSGATLRAAAEALRQAGAHHLTAIVFARTPAPDAPQEADWRE